MFSPPLPPELLIEISKYIEDNDYKTLYSSILINRDWYNVNIPTKWRNPLHSVNSSKILINCLLAEDRDFLLENDIQLRFQLLEKQPPMCNYAKYATELDLSYFLNSIDNLVITNKACCLEERLVNFILEHSTAIRILKIADKKCEWVINHSRFDCCFQNLYELECDFSYNGKFLDKLTKVCKNIQDLKIYNHALFDNCMVLDKQQQHFAGFLCEFSLAELIKAQKQIKKLVIESWKNLVLSINFKKSVSKHSESIIDYESYGATELYHLIPTFKNLKTLKLTDYDDYSDDEVLFTVISVFPFINLKSTLLPNIQEFYLNVYCWPFLLDLTGFIKINGENLRKLTICSGSSNEEYLGVVLQSIGQHCINLEYLSILYKDGLDAQLFDLFDNCTNLKSLEFIKSFRDKTIDGNKVFAILGQSSPRKLNTMHLKGEVVITDDKTLNILMNNWKGPRPFNLILKRLSIDRVLDVDLLNKYQDLGLFNYEILIKFINN